MMLQIIEKLGENSPYIASSQKTWVSDHAASQESQNAASKYAAANQKAGGSARANFYLEGGDLLGQKPKMIRIEEKNEKQRTARIAMYALKPYEEFRSCCVAVYIFMEGATGKIHQTKFSGKKLRNAMDYDAVHGGGLQDSIKF
jgi:hypothetical protein